MYRETPGTLPALRHAVERLAALAETDGKDAALEEVTAHFDQAFAGAVESILVAGGPLATQVEALLDALPAMLERKRSAQSVVVALRTSRSMLGAVEVRTAGARRSRTQRSRVGTHTRSSVEARLGVSVTRLIFRLDAALEFSRTAELDPNVTEEIQTLRDALTRDADAGAEVLACGLVECRAGLERLMKTTAQAADALEQRAHGSARQLFDLVAYA